MINWIFTHLLDFQEIKKKNPKIIKIAPRSSHCIRNRRIAEHKYSEILFMRMAIDSTSRYLVHATCTV